MKNTFGAHTVFWADDDKDDLELFREAMQACAYGYEVIEFGNGRLLLDRLEAVDKKAYPCIIVLDMNMPVLNGRETLMLLKRNPAFKDIPVVVFTTSSSALDKAFCERHHTEMITKPVQFDLLKQSVEKVLSFCNK